MSGLFNKVKAALGDKSEEGTVHATSPANNKNASSQTTAEGGEHRLTSDFGGASTGSHGATTVNPTMDPYNGGGLATATGASAVASDSHKTGNPGDKQGMFGGAAGNPMASDRVGGRQDVGTGAGGYAGKLDSSDSEWTPGKPHSQDCSYPGCKHESHNTATRNTGSYSTPHATDCAVPGCQDPSHRSSTRDTSSYSAPHATDCAVPGCRDPSHQSTTRTAGLTGAHATNCSVPGCQDPSHQSSTRDTSSYSTSTSHATDCAVPGCRDPSHQSSARSGGMTGAIKSSVQGGGGGFDGQGEGYNDSSMGAGKSAVVGGASELRGEELGSYRGEAGFSQGGHHDAGNFRS